MAAPGDVGAIDIGGGGGGARAGWQAMPDPVVLAYYATICACLGVVSPRVRRFRRRLVVGAIVGVLAAGLLPQVRILTGF